MILWALKRKPPRCKRAAAHVRAAMKAIVAIVGNLVVAVADAVAVVVAAAVAVDSDDSMQNRAETLETEDG